jgi:hypothetical protein
MVALLFVMSPVVVLTRLPEMTPPNNAPLVARSGYFFPNRANHPSSEYNSPLKPSLKSATLLAFN